MILKKFIAFIFALYLAIVINPLAAEENRGAGFGGPDTVENLIEDDAKKTGALFEERVTQPWFDWKKKMQQEYGLSLGVDYSAVYLKSSETGASGNDNASAGMLRFFGSWDLVGRGTKNTGAFVWKVEHRHKYTDIAPQGFGFDQGIVGLISPPFSDQGARWTNLYWRQRFNDGKATVIGGFLDATDYVDVFALGSPWTGFMNLAFSIGTSTIYIPNDAAFGIAGGAMLTDKIYIIGGLSDAYADPTDLADNAKSFFQDNEYFSMLELGWTESQDRIYLDNTHLTLWHVDENTSIAAPDGWGLAFQWVTYINSSLMPFVRAGYADDGGTLMQKSVSLGLGYQNIAGGDLFGVGFNWGEPNEKTFTTGLPDQKTLEVFYRFALAEQFVLTPDIQYVMDPALDPTKDSLWILGLRARLAL